MKRKYNLFLKDIVEAIHSIEEYTASLDLEDLKDNRMVVDAVVRNFEIMGEATIHIPDKIKQKYSLVPWLEIRGFRNLIVHKYWVVDLEIMWDIIKNKLEELKEQMNRVLEQEGEV